MTHLLLVWVLTVNGGPQAVFAAQADCKLAAFTVSHDVGTHFGATGKPLPGITALCTRVTYNRAGAPDVELGPK